MTLKLEKEGNKDWVKLGDGDRLRQSCDPTRSYPNVKLSRVKTLRKSTGVNQCASDVEDSHENKPSYRGCTDCIPKALKEYVMHEGYNCRKTKADEYGYKKKDLSN